MRQEAEAIDWYRFLGRSRLPQVNAERHAALRAKSLLVTGAGGSIGSALAIRLAALAPGELVLLESSENNLYTLERKLREAGYAQCFTSYLGSVLDARLMDAICQRHPLDLVVHAAAFKHVAMLEQHPLAALENNVLGTQAIVERALAIGGHVVLLSTDKAAAPVSVLGATKRFAERIVLHSGAGIVVRLGNVLASRGSVVELFQQQIAQGGPMTLTDPDARRYWLTLEESAELLLEALLACDGGPSRLLVPDLAHTHSVRELAEFLLRSNPHPDGIAMECTGLRAGEKHMEVLWDDEEIPLAATHGGLREIGCRPVRSAELEDALMAIRAAIATRSVAAALHALSNSLPGYAPSAQVLALAEAESMVAPA